MMVKKKRYILLLLCLSLLWSALPVQAAGSGMGFSERLAADLKELGLFRGVSDTDFDLARAPMRDEALVMLIRMLGKEQSALEGTWTHPFTDVVTWASGYVGYAWENGLTRGISDTEFGNDTASAAMYLTFMLRALGYSDADGDFTWDNPYALAQTIGLLPSGTNTVYFWRADVVRISYAALSIPMKDGSGTLAEKLIDDGVFTAETFARVYDTEAFAEPDQMTKILSAQEIYARWAPAVFCLETYANNGMEYRIGSGFFINENGIAVTNQHVLANADRATATLTDGTVLNVAGVLYYNQELDYAVIQVDGHHLTALPIGDSAKIAGGEIVYAIGSPQGLVNTISNGIISNPRRDYYNGMLQTTAPISQGSSGGALIDECGRVIAVTSGIVETGQNLNFAVPIRDVLPYGDPARYARMYGTISLADYAAVITSGQSNGQAISINPADDQIPETVEDTGSAFSALKNFILRNANGTLSGSPSYSYTTWDNNGNPVRLQVAYQNSRDGLILSAAMNMGGANLYSYLTLRESGDVYTTFSYYAPGAGQTRTATGTRWLNRNALSLNGDYSFEHYTGPDNVRYSCEQNARYLYCQAVIFANYLLTHYASPVGRYSAFDLGFTGVRVI